jgi:hypothetical protein
VCYTRFTSQQHLLQDGEVFSRSRLHKVRATQLPFGRSRGDIRLAMVTDALVFRVTRQDLSPIRPSACMLSPFLLPSLWCVKRGDDGDDAGAFFFVSPLVCFSNPGRISLSQSCHDLVGSLFWGGRRLHTASWSVVHLCGARWRGTPGLISHYNFEVQCEWEKHLGGVNQ